MTWKQLGFYILLYLAALQNVPKELYEAAETDGAGAVRKFRPSRSRACASDHRSW